MKRVPLALLFALALPAQAQLCEPPTEYAQYKDRAATERGLLNMAADYCLKRDLLAFENHRRLSLASSGIRTSGREANACAGEISKMVGAAEAVGKGQEWAAMTADKTACDQTFARFGIKPK